MDEDDPVVTELDGDFEAQPWQWDARRSDGWIFVSLPEELSDDLRLAAGEPRGFGSVRVCR